MTFAAPKPDLARIGECALAEVLKTFLSLPATVNHSANGSLEPSPSEHITSQVPLSGERFSARVKLQLPLAFVAQAVELLTGLDAESADGIAIQTDTAGELANMVAGRVAAQLTASGYPCRLGTPWVVRAAGLPTPPEPAKDHALTILRCAGQLLFLEIECGYEVA